MDPYRNTPVCCGTDPRPTSQALASAALLAWLGCL